MRLQNYQSTEQRTDVFVSLYRTNFYVTKVPHPCLDCDNVSRDQSYCDVCEATPYYDEYTVGLHEHYKKARTGPEIINKKIKPRKKRPNNNWKILSKLEYKSMSDLIQDLYYDQQMKYTEIASYIRFNVGVPCNKNWVCDQMKANGYASRSNKFYKKNNG